MDLPGGQQIFSYEQFIAGGDGEKLLARDQEPNFRKWFLIDEVIRTLAHYPTGALRREVVAGRAVTRLAHGLDLKLANCVLEAGSNQLYFVDLFGPKELDAQGQWLTYSTKIDSLREDALRAVCATREGALLRCWRLAERHWPNATRSVEQLRQEFLARLPDSELPEPEQRFMAAEITAGYPWLDQLYQEYRV